MPTALFPYILVVHVTLAISLFVPSIVLPFTLRTRKAAADSPGRVMRALLWLQSHGTVVIGLGLALTKRIVEAQGGAVGVRSSPGQGSVFWATLPRKVRR